MTHHAIRTLEDGTRVYSNGTRYRPLPPEQRKHQVRKPDDPRAVLFAGRWFLPLEVLSEEERTMPATRPDEQTLEHRALCRCEVCLRPQASVLWRRARRRERSRATPTPPL